MYSKSFNRSHGTLGSSRDPMSIDTIEYKYYKPSYHHRAHSDHWMEK